MHKSLTEVLPFHPSDEDMDGQIILATISAQMAEDGHGVDEWVDAEYFMNFKTTNVTLLTNDNGLAIRANARGIRTERYGYEHPGPYTGRRDLVVPEELFKEFYNTGKVELELWMELMPNQPKLIVNEFIVMSLENPNDYPLDFNPNNDPYFLYIGKYSSEEKAIVRLKHLRDFPLRLNNAGQAIYAEALTDPNIAAVVCTGPAGSGKTYMATVYGYQACKDGNFIGVTVVPCDSKSKLGALPGDLDEKMDPDVQPLKNALRNYLLKEEPKFAKELATFQKFGAGTKPKNGDTCEEGQGAKSIKQRLSDRVDQIWNNWFSNIPIEYARGRSFERELAIYDEFQDQTVSQADTLIKRVGKEGKIVITGDIEQIHAPYIDASSSGLVYASNLLLNNPMVAQVRFNESEVVRHPLVKMIAERQKARNGNT